MVNSLEKMKLRRSELQKRHQELQEARKTATGLAAHEMYLEMREVGRASGKLGNLIRRARRTGPPSASWFVTMAQCNVPGKGKIRVKAQQKNPKPKRGQR